MNRIIICLVAFCLSLSVSAQDETIKYKAEMLGVASSGDYSPFWLQSKSFGKIASSSNSANFLLGVSKDFDKNTKIFEYGFKADFLVQTFQNTTNTYFHEYYAKARFLVFDFVVGAREENLGNQDSSLTCGGFLFSHNARPMPKITLGIERFTAIPFTKGYAEIKGALVHGWFADSDYEKKVLLHHKYLYLKFGGQLPVRIQYGLDHVTQWGGYIPGWGEQPSGFHDYINVFFGRSGDSGANISDQINALGNHIISQSLGLDIDVKNITLGAYWQVVNEDTPLRIIGNTMNRPDGLWGVSIHNKTFPYISGVLYELLNTTDSSGPFHDKDGIIYGGGDSYFNGQYPAGWSYFSRTIGTPFISSPLYNQNAILGITNNKVRVHHIGVEGDIKGFQYKVLNSFSRNYFSNFENMIENKSLFLKVNKQFPTLSNIELGCSMAADIGSLYGDSFGFQLSIRKTGILFKY